MNTESLIGLAVVFILGGAWIVQRSRKTTRIDASGVLFVRSLSRAQFLPWSEIESFGIASVSRIEEGLHQPGFTQCLGVQLESSSEKKQSRACRENRRLSDYDMLLTEHLVQGVDVLFYPDPGMSAAEFATYLENEKAKFKRANQIITVNAGAAPRRV